VPARLSSSDPRSGGSLSVSRPDYVTPFDKARKSELAAAWTANRARFTQQGFAYQ